MYLPQLLRDYVFSNQTWVSSFTANLLSSLFGVVVGILVTIRIERLLVRQKEKSRQEQVANLIWSELRLNRERLDKLITHMPKGDLVFPALETSIWDSIDRQSFIDFFNFGDIHRIISIYARTTTINGMYDTLLGRTDWVAGDDPKTISDVFMTAFVERCRELVREMEKLAALFKERCGMDIFQK